METWREELYANLGVSQELYHHGIKGQKWGVRRFQNPDGTLTEEGRKRYGVDGEYRKDFESDHSDEYEYTDYTKNIKHDGKDVDFTVMIDDEDKGTDFESKTFETAESIEKNLKSIDKQFRSQFSTGYGHRPEYMFGGKPLDQQDIYLAFVDVTSPEGASIWYGSSDLDKVGHSLVVTFDPSKPLEKQRIDYAIEG